MYEFWNATRLHGLGIIGFCLVPAAGVFCAWCEITGRHRWIPRLAKKTALVVLGLSFATLYVLFLAAGVAMVIRGY